MEYYYIALRLLHVLTVAIWTGYTIMLALFILPAINSLGPDGGKFMQAVAKTRNFPAFMSALTGLAILSGILMYIKLTGPGFMASKFGIVLTSGATTGILAFITGTFIVGSPVKKLAKIGEAISGSGAPPSDAQKTEMAKLRGKISTGTKLTAFLLLLSILLMAAAKYI